MAVVTLSSKGQLVIPAFIRKALKIGPKSKIRVTLSDDGTKAIIEPLPENPIDALTGILKDYSGSLAKELVEERRRDRDHEET